MLSVSSLARGALAFAIAIALSPPVVAQDDASDASTALDTVVVVGTHLRKSEEALGSPVQRISREQLEATGRLALGDALQEISASGSAINTRLNTSGNQGAPPDGGGIGAGSVQLDLRHLEAKRVLVLVDGRRWVYETSGSGVGGAVDLNTIPLAIVDRVEILEDGASAIYGSDAIAGVVNVVTRRRYDGIELLTSYGEFDDGDGAGERAELTLGGGSGILDGVLSLSWQRQGEVRSSDRDISSLPQPNTGNTRGSPVNPQGAAIFVTPRTSGIPCAPIDANRDGTPDASLCQVAAVPGAAVGANGAVPFPDGWRPLTLADNFNAQPFNLALTPNERTSLYANANVELGDAATGFVRALVNRRESRHQAAPSPIVLGPEAPGQNLADRVGVSRLNPFNPFGIDLVPGTNLFALARRPLEAGPRIFEQEVDTHYLSAGLEGTFDANERVYAWDVSYVTSESDATQAFRNSFDVRRIQQALGDPVACAAIPGCTPLNLFGGQGADGAGTITPAMLDFIRRDFFDESSQSLDALTAHVAGDLFDVPAGPIAFATGLEWRRHEGSYTPDAARTRGEVMDLAADVPIAGDYEVRELYGEVDVPLVADAAWARSLDLGLAARHSDYDAFDAVTTAKANLRWRPADAWLLRATWSEGFRAPFIGERFSTSTFGSTVVDRCSNYTASGDATLIADCTALGVPASYRQLGFQVFTTTGGDPGLEPESSESWSLGLVWSPDVAGSVYADVLEIELNAYDHVVDDAIVAPTAQDVLDACIATGSTASPECAGITRNPSGQIGRFENRLANIGTIETSGIDLKLDWSLETTLARFDARWATTYVDEYAQTDRFGNAFTRTVGVEFDDGAIPEWQSNLSLAATRGDFTFGWDLRYIASLDEPCSDALDNTPQSLIALGLCGNVVDDDPARSTHGLGSVTYHDLRFGWNAPFGAQDLSLAFGLENAFGKEPPPCYTCALNGYDATTYDLPGRYGYVQATYRFD